MQIALLTLLKLVLLGMLYLFLFRAVRVIVVDLYGPRRKGTSPRPAVAASPAPDARRSRKTPREIVVHPPSGRPQVHRLDGRPAVLGRSTSSTLVVDDVYISDEHAEILPGEGGWSVRDLGSTNGTFLNGAKVARPTSLAVGDQIKVGKTRVEVRR